MFSSPISTQPCTSLENTSPAFDKGATTKETDRLVMLPGRNRSWRPNPRYSPVVFVVGPARFWRHFTMMGGFLMMGGFSKRGRDAWKSAFVCLVHAFEPCALGSFL